MGEKLGLASIQVMVVCAHGTKSSRSRIADTPFVHNLEPSRGFAHPETSRLVLAQIRGVYTKRRHEGLTLIELLIGSSICCRAITISSGRVGCWATRICDICDSLHSFLVCLLIGRTCRSISF
jgi:hypothetical protein